MITTANFKLKFKEFTCKTDDEIQIFLDEAVELLNEAFWDTKYDLGLYYLTAHLLALSDRMASTSTKAIATAGPISSKSVDGVSISFAVSEFQNAAAEYYRQTLYGQRYWALLRGLPVAAILL